jgi:hypothetical protein
MHSKATTVEEYLASLPEDRRAAITAVRQVILANLEGGYEEGMQYGMIGYFIPHRIYPAGYHCDPKQPVPFAGLASQKNHMSLYLMGLYIGCDGGEATPIVKWFTQAWTKGGRKLDMGRACVRFKTIDDVPLDVLGEAIARMPLQTYLDAYVKLLPANRKAAAAATPSAKAKAPTKAAPKAKPASTRNTSIAPTKVMKKTKPKSKK